ncbi:hypothetical protein PoB_006420600 [Plakobranchus ocellatus]|uniref:SMB domain-containing protein n=1 Tax=Plakobranchus ocellatus TaxID=259542 RepID=A0AAV4D0V8_9GAST|nr:hypothetical protein PoB_006420600 [Plakobranchus ocellatus]
MTFSVSFQMELCRHQHSTSSDVLVLTLIAFLPFTGPSFLSTDVFNKSNITNPPGSVEMAAIFSVNQTDTVDIKNLSSSQMNEIYFTEQTRTSIQENPGTSQENSSISCPVPSMTDELMNSGIHFAAKKNTYCENGQRSCVQNSENQLEPSLTALCNPLSAVNISMAFSGMTLSNELTGEFEEGTDQTSPLRFAIAPDSNSIRQCFPQFDSKSLLLTYSQTTESILIKNYTSRDETKYDKTEISSIEKDCFSKSKSSTDHEDTKTLPSIAEERLNKSSSKTDTQALPLLVEDPLNTSSSNTDTDALPSIDEELFTTNSSKTDTDLLPSIDEYALNRNSSKTDTRVLPSIDEDSLETSSAKIYTTVLPSVDNYALDTSSSKIDTEVLPYVDNYALDTNSTKTDPEALPSVGEYALNTSSSNTLPNYNNIERTTATRNNALQIRSSKTDNGFKNAAVTFSSRRHSHYKNDSEIKADVDDIEMSTLMYKLSSNTSEINTDQAAELSVSSEEDDDIDRTLIFTCQGRCGKTISFPCSCSSTCVVYDTCCVNMTTDCPHDWEEGLSRFDHIRRADFTCSKHSIYMISTCPSQVKTENEWTDTELASMEQSVPQKANLSLMTGNWALSSRMRKSDSPEPQTSAESDLKSQQSIIQKLYEALSAAPVTDSETGFTFTNKAIYNCNNMPEATALTWSLRLDYDFVSPTGLEDFDDGKPLDEYRPAFNTRILEAHLCLPDLIETCKLSEALEEKDEVYVDKCQGSMAVVMLFVSEFGMQHFLYRNRFCAYCNAGKLKRYKLFGSNAVGFRGSQFQVLMSLSQKNTFNFKLSKSSLITSSIKFPWSQATCSIPEQVASDSLEAAVASETLVSESRAVCSVACEHPSFTLRSDGHCKAQHAALLAISDDDGLPPLCHSAMKKMAKFFLCGLESEVESLRNADLVLKSVSTVFDSQTYRNLYVVELRMVFPEISDWFFSSARNESVMNVRHLALLAKAFKDYRLFEKLCTQEEDQRQDNLTIIHTFPWITYLDRISLPYLQSMEELRGQIVDNQNTTTVCITQVSGFLDIALDTLKCMDDPVYERDALWLSKFRSSPCFSHLEDDELTGRDRATAVMIDDGILFVTMLTLNFLSVFLGKP